MFGKVEKQLKSFGKTIKMDERISGEIRASLLSKISSNETAPALASIKAFNPFLYLNYRTLSVASVVLIVSTGCIGTVSASLSSLPGDLLYPVKITTEKLQVALITDEGEKTKLKVSFAGRRLQEATEIINKEENGEKEVKVALAVLKFRAEVLSIQVNLPNLNEESKKSVEDSIAAMNSEVEKITLANETAEIQPSEIIAEIPAVFVELDEKDPATTTPRVVGVPAIKIQPKITEPEETFKIQLQIIDEQL